MKKALIVLIPVIGIGITLALAFMGIIRIPGITPEKESPSRWNVRGAEGARSTSC